MFQAERPAHAVSSKQHVNIDWMLCTVNSPCFCNTSTMMMMMMLLYLYLLWIILRGTFAKHIINCFLTIDTSHTSNEFSSADYAFRQIFLFFYSSDQNVIKCVCLDELSFWSWNTNLISSNHVVMDGFRDYRCSS